MEKTIDKLIANVDTMTDDEKEWFLTEYKNHKDKINEETKIVEELKPLMYAILGDKDEMTINNRLIYVKAREQEDKTKVYDELKAKYPEIWKELKSYKVIVSLFVK